MAVGGREVFVGRGKGVFVGTGSGVAVGSAGAVFVATLAGVGEATLSGENRAVIVRLGVGEKKGVGVSAEREAASRKPRGQNAKQQERVDFGAHRSPPCGALQAPAPAGHWGKPGQLPGFADERGENV